MTQSDQIAAAVFVKAIDMNEVSAAIWETEPASSQIVSIEEVPPDEEVREV